MKENVSVRKLGSADKAAFQDLLSSDPNIGAVRITGSLFGLFLDEQLIGLAWITEAKRNRLFLRYSPEVAEKALSLPFIFIHPEHREKGYQDFLLDETLRQGNPWDTQVMVTAHDKPKRQFFESHGFKEIAQVAAPGMNIGQIHIMVKDCTAGKKMKVRRLQKKDIPELWKLQKALNEGAMQDIATFCALETNLYLTDTVPAPKDMNPINLVGLFADNRLIGYALDQKYDEFDIITELMAPEEKKMLQMADYHCIECRMISYMYIAPAYDNIDNVQKFLDHSRNSGTSPVYLEMTDDMYYDNGAEYYKSLGLVEMPFNHNCLVPQEHYWRLRDFFECIGE